MNLKMKSVKVEAKTRPIRAAWTREMAADISSFHSIDIDNELSAILKREIRKSKASNIFGK